MKQVTWTQLLCVLTVAVAVYYGLLYFLVKRRRNRCTTYRHAQSGIRKPHVFPSNTFCIIEQKSALPEFFKSGDALVTPAINEVVESTTQIEYTAAEMPMDMILVPDQVLDEGIDLENLIYTFELASKSTVTEGEKESLGQTAGALYDDAYFQQLLTGNDTIRQKVEWALLRPDNNGSQLGQLIYHTQEAVA